MELNIVRDNGEIEIFNAYRVQHDNSRGPFKGGFRFSPNVSMDEVRRCVLRPAHACSESWLQCVCLNIPQLSTPLLYRGVTED